MMKKLLVQILAVVLFAACSQKIEYLPNSFYDYSLKQKLTGKEAKDFVNRLHFNSVTEEKNEIGFYNNGDRKAVIYITFYESNSAAEINYKKMTEKISPENSVFIRGSFIEVNGESVYRTFGMGQTHYVFVHNELLFWISVDTVMSKEFIGEYLKLIS